VNKVMVDKSAAGPGVVPYLPLPELKPGQSMPKAPAPAPAPATTGGQR
jgi:membrane protease subunit HflK